MSKTLLRLRAQAASAQTFRCFYCKCPVWMTDPHPFMARFGLTSRQAQLFKCTAEHLDARRDGGKNNQANIAAACLHCNHKRHRARHPLAPADYRERVQRLVKRGGWFPAGLARKMTGSLPS